MDRFTFPPGPALPAALQAAWLIYRPYQFLERCQRAHGDAFTIASMLGRVVVFARPDYVERIFDLDSDGTTLLGGTAQTPAVVFAGDESLMKLDGSTHREHREILAAAFRAAELPHGGAELLDRIRGAVAGWPVGRRFDLSSALDRLAVDLVGYLGLGEDQPPPELAAAVWRSWPTVRRASTPAGLIQAALTEVRPGGKRCPFAPVRKLVEQYLHARIERREHAAPCVLRHVATGHSARGTALGAVSVRDEMMMLLTAMLGALSCSMKHSFYWALRTPGVADRVRAETAGAVAALDPRALTAAPYLDAVCKEIPRLCPDIPFAVRRTVRDVAIGPWQLPVGTTLGLGIYLLHRREASFPKADRFQPERFLTAPGARAGVSRFEYLPFGGGRRGCVAGSYFSFVQKLILAAVFERHHLSLCDRRENPVTSLAVASTPARRLWTIAAAPVTAPPPQPWIVHPGTSDAAATGPHSRGQGERAAGRHEESRRP
jgi:cytochrome P450